jgi:hypothetical protein
MKCVITDQIVLSRAPGGPLSVYVGPFADFLSAQGYALKSIHRQVHLPACFSQWLQRKGVELPHITADHAKQYYGIALDRSHPTKAMRLHLSMSLAFYTVKASFPPQRCRYVD